MTGAGRAAPVARPPASAAADLLTALHSSPAMKVRALKRQAYVGAVLMSVSFLAFLLGAFVVRGKWWPYPTIWKSFMAARAFKHKLLPAEKYGDYFYQRARTEQTGVRHHDPAAAYGGLTLFTSAHAQKAHLVAMDGEIVHEWHLPFSRVWPSPDHLGSGAPDDEFVTLGKALLLPDGDLLAMYACPGETPWGCGLVRMDHRSTLVWKYPGRVHHDVELGSDGTIYTLAHAVVSEPIPGLPSGVTPPLLEDFVVVLSPEGRELKRLAVTDLFRDSVVASLLELPRSNLAGDLWHANGIEPLDEALAEKFPTFRAGQLLISLRAVDAIAVVDLEQEKAVWAALGGWRAQHDPDFLPNGNILLFDNLGHCGPEGRSRVVEIDPATLRIDWQYAGTTDVPLYSERRAAQQRLPNGNTLITESYAGRIVEVTADHQIVWEYLSPFRAPHDPLLVGIVGWAQRFDRDTLRFEFAGPLPD